MALSKDSILKHAGTINRKEVHIPAWADESGDDVVIVRGLTIREWEIHQARLGREAAAAGDKDPKGDANARLIARCVIDENGARVFGDDDINAISNLGLGDVLKLQEAINEASGLGDDAEADARGESEPTPNFNSSTE
jgi:hypothetical protein